MNINHITDAFGTLEFVVVLDAVEHEIFLRWMDVSGYDLALEAYQSVHPDLEARRLEDIRQEVPDGFQYVLGDDEPQIMGAAFELIFGTDDLDEIFGKALMHAHQG
jgi:hypothetical protein